jgi:hypothetical protein
MKRLTMALLALGVLAAGVSPTFAGNDAVGDYYYRDLWKGKGHRGEARVKADTETCIVRAGYPNLASQLRAATRDPAYLGCMRARGWALSSYTPPRHRSHGGHGGYDGSDSSAQNGGTTAAEMAASQAQNDAAQAQFNQGINDSQQFMNYMNEQTPHE